MHEITIAKIGSWIWTIIPVVSGSCYAFISSNQELTKLKSWMSFIMGTFIAFVISRGVIEHFNIAPLSYFAYSIQIIVGLFIIQAIGESFKQIPKFFDAIRLKYFGS